MKRARESAEVYIPIKRVRKTGAGAISDVGIGMEKIADALVTEPPTEKVPEEMLTSTIQGKACAMVLDEGCLTDDGQLEMMDILENTTFARQYLAMEKRDGLRTKWLKKQLEKTGKAIESLFTEWEPIQ